MLHSLTIGGMSLKCRRSWHFTSSDYFAADLRSDPQVVSSWSEPANFRTNFRSNASCCCLSANRRRQLEANFANLESKIVDEFGVWLCPHYFVYCLRHFRQVKLPASLCLSANLSTKMHFDSFRVICYQYEPCYTSDCLRTGLDLCLEEPRKSSINDDLKCCWATGRHYVWQLVDYYWPGSHWARLLDLLMMLRFRRIPLRPHLICPNSPIHSSYYFGTLRKCLKFPWAFSVGHSWAPIPAQDPLPWTRSATSDHRRLILANLSR